MDVLIIIIITFWRHPNRELISLSVRRGRTFYLFCDGFPHRPPIFLFFFIFYFFNHRRGTHPPSHQTLRGLRQRWGPLRELADAASDVDTSSEMTCLVRWTAQLIFRA